MGFEGQQFGRYKLLRILGGGGMGEVYLAEDVHIRRQVAMKVLRAEGAAHPDMSASHESSRLFRREIRAIAMLDHPHILPLFDYGEETVNTLALTYMVMPLRTGGSLTTWVEQRGGFSTLSLADIVHFVQQAASALQYAHRHQVIHQDVKPSNFLMRIDEEETGLPDLQLADFGIAKLFTATSSMTQTPRGTPAFMAPEQWSGNPVPASDQYALAIMAYQMLTGNPPFQGRAEQVMFHHFQTTPPPPSTANPHLSPEVDAVILRALAKQPEARYPRIIDFARALSQALAGSTDTIVCPSPVPPPIVTPCKRVSAILAKGRKIIIPVSIVLALIVSGFVVNAVFHPFTPGSGVLTLSDSLSSGWPGKTDNGGSCQFTDGSYHVVAAQQSPYNCISGNTFSNFKYQVHMTIVGGNGGGIIFRSNATNTNYYYFDIGIDGSFVLGLYENSQSSSDLIGSSSAGGLIPNTTSGQITIAVAANGSTITLYVNTQQVASVQNSTYSNGYIGMAADGESEVAFNNVKVWTF